MSERLIVYVPSQQGLRLSDKRLNRINVKTQSVCSITTRIKTASFFIDSYQQSYSQSVCSITTRIKTLFFCFAFCLLHFSECMFHHNKD